MKCMMFVSNCFFLLNFRVFFEMKWDFEPSLANNVNR